MFIVPPSCHNVKLALKNSLNVSEESLSTYYYTGGFAVMVPLQCHQGKAVKLIILGCNFTYLID